MSNSNCTFLLLFQFYFRHILNDGLDLASQFSLPDSDKFDCVTCGHISDIDMDGKNEILLGTYGQVSFLFFKIWITL